MLEIIYFMFIIKQHIFYDTYTMFLIYDEIEQKNGLALVIIPKMVKITILDILSMLLIHF